MGGASVKLLVSWLRWPPRSFFAGCAVSALISVVFGWSYFVAEIDRTAYRCNLPADGTPVVGHYDARSRNAVCIRVNGRNGGGT